MTDGEPNNPFGWSYLNPGVIHPLVNFNSNSSDGNAPQVIVRFYWSDIRAIWPLPLLSVPSAFESCRKLHSACQRQQLARPIDEIRRTNPDALHWSIDVRRLLVDDSLKPVRSGCDWILSSEKKLAKILLKPSHSFVAAALRKINTSISGCFMRWRTNVFGYPGMFSGTPNTHLGNI